MKVTHSTNSAAMSRRGHKAFSGFTTVELAVSLGLFLLVATFITLTIARSISAGAQARAERVASESTAGMLSILSTYSYDALASGKFTVPAPCTGTAVNSAISGVSCPDGDSGKARVKYFYQEADGTCPDLTDGKTAAGWTGTATSRLEQGVVGLCAVAVQPDGTVKYPYSMDQISVNAPWFGYSAQDPDNPDNPATQRGVVRVGLSGDATAAGYPANLYLVSDPSVPGAPAGYAVTPVLEGQAVFTDIDTRSLCTATHPCMVSLTAGSTGTMSNDSGFSLFGSAARPGAGIVARSDMLTDVAVSGGSGASLAVSLKSASGVSPTVTDSVCLTIALSSPEREVLACNNSSAGTITFTGYTQDGGVYALEPGTQATLLSDTQKGFCTGGRALSPAGSWTGSNVCTTWVWGPASFSSNRVNLSTSSTSTATWASGTPASGLTDGSSSWTEARTEPECAKNGTCTPVFEPPESYLCPGQACLSLGQPS